MYNNPFMNSYSNIGNGLKTPQQYQQELSQLQQQYANQYNNMMSQQSQIQQAPNNYGWKYLENDNEIETLQVPVNGNPYMLVGNGVFYIKKWANGQPVIQAYSFAPLNATKEGNISENKKEQANNQDSKEEGLNDLKTILNKINERLDKLENNKVEKVNAEIVDNPFIDKEVK